LLSTSRGFLGNEVPGVSTDQYSKTNLVIRDSSNTTLNAVADESLTIAPKEESKTFGKVLLNLPGLTVH